MESEYELEVKKYGKKDAIIALCAWLVWVAVVLIGWGITSLGLTQVQSLIIQILLISIIPTGIVFTIVIIKKQGLNSIGIHNTRLLPTLRFGVLLALILSVFGIVPGLIYGWEFNSLGMTTLLLLYAFILAAAEDILFVGYLQTRLYGIFKKDVTAIFIGAVLFTLPHIPVALISPYLGLGFVSYLVMLFIAHVLMVLVFRRYFSLIPVFIAHTLGNFFSIGDIWSEFNPEYSEFWTGNALILILLILVALEIVRWWRNRAKRQTLS